MTRIPLFFLLLHVVGGEHVMAEGSLLSAEGRQPACRASHSLVKRQPALFHLLQSCVRLSSFLRSKGSVTYATWLSMVVNKEALSVRARCKACASMSR